MFSLREWPPPLFFTPMRLHTILIKVNFERLKLIISLRFLDGNFLSNLSVYSLMLWCKNILVFQEIHFLFGLRKMSMVVVHQKYCTKHKALHAVLWMRILVLRGFPVVYLIFRVCLISQIFKGNICKVFLFLRFD